MMSPLEPKHLRPQQNEIRHVTTELALRWFDEAITLKKNKTPTAIGTRLVELLRSFSSMDPENRASLLIRLVEKENEFEAGLDEEARRESGYVYPEGARLTHSLMDTLPAVEAQRTFWSVLATLGNGDRSGSRDGRRVSAATLTFAFIERAKDAFSASDWHDIGERILNVYAHDTRIPEDVRKHAVDSYLRLSFKNIYNVLVRAENSIEESASLSPGYVDEEVKDLLVLHPAIVGIVLDERLEGSFRASTLDYTAFRICPEDTRKKVAELAYTQGVDEKLSEGVINWLKFPHARDDPGAVNPYDVLEKVVREREDSPFLQLSAMETLLDRDARLAPRSVTHSNIKEFTRTIDKIWKTDPHRARPESHVYEKLTKTADGRLYIQNMMNDKEAMRRIAGVYAALRGDQSLLLDQRFVRRCVNDISTGLDEVKDRSFCCTVVESLCNTGSFNAGDALVLRGLKKALGKLHDEGAARAASAVDRVLARLPA